MVREHLEGPYLHAAFSSCRRMWQGTDGLHAAKNLNPGAGHRWWVARGVLHPSLRWCHRLTPLLVCRPGRVQLRLWLHHPRVPGHQGAGQDVLNSPCCAVNSPCCAVQRTMLCGANGCAMLQYDLFQVMKLSRPVLQGFRRLLHPVSRAHLHAMYP